MKKRKKQNTACDTPTKPSDGVSKEKGKPDPKNIQKLRQNVKLHQKPLIMRGTS